MWKREERRISRRCHPYRACLRLSRPTCTKTHSSQLTRSAMRLLEPASPRQSNETRGIPPTSTRKFTTDAGHDVEVEAEVVDGVERRAQRLLRDEEVAQVGAGVALADHAGACGVDGSLVLSVLDALDVHADRKSTRLN